MMMTTKTSRGRNHKRPRDTTPCTIQVREGTLVYFDGEQRGGLIANVPKHIAMEWLRQRFADVVYEEPVGAGAASTAITRSTVAQDVAKTAQSLGESDDLRGTSTDATPGHPPLPPGSQRTPRRPAKNAPYGSPKIGEPEGVAAQHVSDSNLAGPADTPDDPRTVPVRVPRTCPNCGKPVSGRRKWCSDACRLQAYRGRTNDE